MDKTDNRNLAIIHKAASINGISSRNASGLYLPSEPIISSADKTLVISDAASHPNPIIEELTSPTYQNPAAERSEKTSRFIAQLQEKLTRISREVAFHEATSKELEKENQLLRTQIEDGRSRLGTLEQVHEADLHSLDAQDRKIKRLKAELEEEKSRRIKAEVASQSAVVNAADTVQKANRDVVRAQELATYATSSYETLQKAFDKEKQRNLSEEKKMKENIAAISSAFRERIESISRVERKRTLDLERLDAVIAAKDEVIRQYESNSRKQSDAFAAYRDERDGEIRELRESARDKIQESEDVLESLKEIRGRMKWIISVKRDVKGAG